MTHMHNFLSLSKLTFKKMYKHVNKRNHQKHSQLNKINHPKLISRKAIEPFSRISHVVYSKLATFGGRST